jgi:hypothetical protein
VARPSFELSLLLLMFFSIQASADHPIAGAATLAQRSRRHCEPVHHLHPNPTFRDGHHIQWVAVGAASRHHRAGRPSCNICYTLRCAPFEQGHGFKDGLAPPGYSTPADAIGRISDALIENAWGRPPASEVCDTMAQTSPASF